MRFVYADAGLRDDSGHHANSCRAITLELKRRGITPEILAFEGITPPLRQDLDAIPFFRWFTYWLDPDPICGWLKAFHDGWQSLSADLAKTGHFTPSDVLYLNSAQPYSVMGMSHWLGSLPAANRPHVVMEFGTDPGLDIVTRPNGIEIFARDPRIDPRAALHRLAAQSVPQDVWPNLHLMTFDSISSALFSRLLEKEVGVLPLPQLPSAPVRRRGSARPITVSVLGHQRPEKGYHHLPEITRILLQSPAEIRLLIHNGKPNGMIETQQALRALAASDKQIILDERAIGAKEWSQLLDQSDLILCPYDASNFAQKYSAVTAEAIANGIPMVVPKGTTLEKTMQEFGAGLTVFENFDPPSIAQATLAALEKIENLATDSFAAADRWKKSNGPAKTVDAILSFVSH